MKARGPEPMRKFVKDFAAAHSWSRRGREADKREQGRRELREAMRAPLVAK